MCSFDILQATIDILKIDIECSEWTSFDAILANPRCLSNVKQLMVEFHPCRVKSETKTPQEILSCWRTLRAIDDLGFKLWKVWNNHATQFMSRRFKSVKYYGAFNAYYLNIKYLLWSLKCMLIKTTFESSREMGMSEHRDDRKRSLLLW